jgi:hypothetical protein
VTAPRRKIESGNHPARLERNFQAARRLSYGRIFKRNVIGALPTIEWAVTLWSCRGATGLYIVEGVGG